MVEGKQSSGGTSMESWLVYGSIAAGGFAFLLLSLILGGDGGHDGDASDFHTDGVEVAGDGAGHSLSDLGSFFSLKVISAFAVGFGGAGAGASVLNPNPLVALGSGLGFGIIMALASRAVIAMFLKNESSSHTTESSLIGQQGVVTQTILAGRTGEVEVKGTYRAARSVEGVELKAGQHIRVTALGSTLTVEALDSSK